MPRVKHSYLLLVTTSDEYQLPVACFESTSELARYLGVTRRAVQLAVQQAVLTCPLHLLPTYIAIAHGGYLVFLIPESEV